MGNSSTYGIYSTINLTIAQIKSGKWNRFVAEDTFLKGVDTSNKWDMKNTAYFLEYETGKYKTKMRVGMCNGASAEFCGMMICRLAGNETAQTAAAACRYRFALQGITRNYKGPKSMIKILFVCHGNIFA